MQRKLTLLLFAVLFVFAGAIVAYSQCAEVAHQLDAGTEHDTPLIHCPQPASTYSAQASSLGRGYSASGKALLSSATSVKTGSGIGYFRESTFAKIFSQQDLYRLEEVFRL